MLSDTKGERRIRFLQRNKAGENRPRESRLGRLVPREKPVPRDRAEEHLQTDVIGRASEPQSRRAQKQDIGANQLEEGREIVPARPPAFPQVVHRGGTQDRLHRRLPYRAEDAGIGVRQPLPAAPSDEPCRGQSLILF